MQMKTLRGEHSRHNSDCRPSVVPLVTVLQCMNPKGLRSVSLNDLRGVLKAIPPACRPKVQEVCEMYIYKYHSFQMQMDVFARMYQDSVRSLDKPSPQRPRQRPFPRPVESALRRKLQSLSQERLFITYDASFKALISKKPNQSPEPNYLRKTCKRLEPRLSHSTDFSPADGSYADMYSRKERERRVLEWADIRTAEAVAACKGRARSPVSPKTKKPHVRSASAEEILDSHRSSC